MVSAASYEARAFGVRSAMPIVEAIRRCPQAVFLAGRMARYLEVSKEVFAIFRRYTPLVEGLSLDEAFLDVTESRSLFGDGAAVARRIKDAVRGELQLTASAGVAPCKFVAKVASDLKKPDGLVVVEAEAVATFLAPLPIERMWGVGPKAAARLREQGMESMGDLARAGGKVLRALLGSWGEEVARLARGIDPRPVVPGRAAQSVGAEETFEADVTDLRQLERHLLGQSARVARRLHVEGLCGRVVVVKVKYADFTLKTRRCALPEPVADTDSIYEAAKGLLGRFALRGRRVRLTGVSVAGLSPGPPPRTLFPDPTSERRLRVEDATARIRERFGARSLTRATLIEDE